MADTKLVTRQLPVDTDGTLAADSDAKIPTQKAVKTYVDNATGGSGISESLAIAYAVALG